MITPATPEQVRSLNGSVLTDDAIQPFIDAAVCVLSQVESCMIGKGLTDDCQTLASAYLACHLMAISPIGQKTNIKQEEKFENYSVKLAVGSYSAAGVLSTPYGATANSMSGGCLQEVDKRRAFIGFFGGA